MSPHNPTVLFEETVSLVDIPLLIPKVVRELATHDGFFLALDGSVGAGKSTFVRALLRALGWPEFAPVNSPTYTLVNEYPLPSGLLAHFDFYRIDSDRDAQHLLEDQSRYRGILAEWTPESLRAQVTHALSIEPGTDHRVYRFTRI